MEYKIRTIDAEGMSVKIEIVPVGKHGGEMRLSLWRGCAEVVFLNGRKRLVGIGNASDTDGGNYLVLMTENYRELHSIPVSNEWTTIEM